MTERLFDEVSFEERCKNFDHNFALIREQIALAAKSSGRRPEDITLLAATKTVPPELISYAIDNGLSYVGENKVQELLSKYDCYRLPKENIHFIGHLQTNKVSSLIGKVGMIQSVDSLRLATEIHKRSLSAGLVTDVLIEINIGDEDSKSGIHAQEAETLIEQCSALDGIRVKGLMSIPPITANPDDARKFFSSIYKLSVDIREKNMDNVSMDILSMGMSADYFQAICEGATMVRIGSLLFGKRIY